MSKAADKFEVIIEDISNGLSLRKACEKNDVKLRTFRDYLANNEDKDAQYTRAREERSEKIFEEMFDIADEASRDEDNPQAVSRARLQIDTRKWALSKMLPKKYGDKLDIDHTTKGEKLIFTPINLDVKEE